MKKLVVLSGACALLALVTAALALGAARATLSLSAKLGPGREVPKAKAPAAATGTFTATLSGRTLKWKLTFAHLSGPAAAAHIHKGGAGVSGPVLVPLCGPCKSGQKGTVTVTSAAAKTIATGKVYVNVHTAKNPGGEIRAQVAVKTA